jgi:chemotaxis protein CheD
MEIKIKFAEMTFSNNKEDILIANGLAASVAVIIFDAITSLGGMLHVVMPNSSIQENNNNLLRFADTALPLFLNEFKSKGGSFVNLKLVIVGGASVLGSVFNIGDKNVEIVKKEIEKYSLKLTGEDIGGKEGRTATLFIKDGSIKSKIFAGKERTF